MKELDDIFHEKRYELGPSYTRNVALSLQPQSFSDFLQHPEFDEVFRLWTQGWNWYGLDKARVWALAINLKRVLSRTSGSLAEVGVYKGNSASLLSHYAREYARRIYLCDTFDGFDPSQFEDDFSEGKIAAFKDAGLHIAQSRVAPHDGVRWVKGMFPDSVTEEMRQDSFAFVHLDCDIYAPTLSGLDFFWPRLERGGLVFIHDYASGYWPGAAKAVDEFCDANGVEGFVLPDACGTFVLTKGA